MFALLSRLYKVRVRLFGQRHILTSVHSPDLLSTGGAKGGCADPLWYPGCSGDRSPCACATRQEPSGGRLEGRRGTIRILRKASRIRRVRWLDLGVPFVLLYDSVGRV